MRVLTVKQPWAWAIIYGGKDVENRVRNIAGDYRGPVAIHAGIQTDVDAAHDPRILAAWKAAADTGTLPKHRIEGKLRHQSIYLEYSAIIGVVDLTDAHHANEPFSGCETEVDLNGEGATMIDLCSPWAEPDVYHLVLANPRPLSVPMEWKGALGIRHLPDEIPAMVMELQRG